MLASIGRGDFYILCPDNEVEHATDEKRILWAAGDIVENRPALSRWQQRAGAMTALLASALSFAVRPIISKSSPMNRRGV